MHNNSTSYAAGHWQISFNIKMLVGVSGVRCNVRPWLTYNIRILFYIKDFFYNVSVCFLFYSRVTDNRKTHDSGVQIVERGGSGERVKLYIGSGRVGGGEGKSGSLPLSPSKLPAFFFFVNFSPALYYPNARNRLPEESLESRKTQAEIRDSANHYGDSNLISQLLKGICVIVIGDWTYYCPLTKWQSTNLT